MFVCRVPGVFRFLGQHCSYIFSRAWQGSRFCHRSTSEGVGLRATAATDVCVLLQHSPKDDISFIILLLPTRPERPEELKYTHFNDHHTYSLLGAISVIILPVYHCSHSHIFIGRALGTANIVIPRIHYCASKFFFSLEFYIFKPLMLAFCCSIPTFVHLPGR